MVTCFLAENSNEEVEMYNERKGKLIIGDFE